MVRPIAAQTRVWGSVVHRLRTDYLLYEDMHAFLRASQM
jgi:hypothetical protein